MADDRFYFRQLLSGRDFAANDPIAQQMVNFVYAVGDRAKGECVLIDPAYAVNELLDIVEADGMKVTGVLATHFHADHIGGNMMGHQVEGVATLLERCSCPVHVQRDEVPWVTRTSGLGADQLVAHDGGDVVKVGDIEITLVHTPGPHARQPVLPRRRPAGQRRHAVPRRLRAHRLPGQRPGGDVRQPADAGRDARGHRGVSRPPLLAAVERHHRRHPRDELRVPPEDQGAVAD